MSKPGNDCLQILQSEYRRVTNAIELRESRVFRVLLFGFPILGTGLATAVRFDLHVAIALVPFLVEILGLYWVTTSRDILVWGGYARYLGERLNHIVESPCLRWEDVANRHLQLNIAAVALGAFIIGVWLISVVFGLEAALKIWDGQLQKVAVLILFPSLLITGLVSIIYVASRFKSFWQMAYASAWVNSSEPANA